MTKNSYKLLNIQSGATDKEIEEAYMRARALYGEDSIATYSLYTLEEREAMLNMVIEAYETLRDPVKRRNYDNSLKALHQEKNHTGGLKVAKISPQADEQQQKISKPVATVKLKDSLVVAGNDDPITTEQYRILYTMLEAISARDFSKTFLVTSALKGEGKTSTVLNLAYLMAKEFKKRTIVVECDLKNPTIVSGYLAGAPKYGLVECLKSELDLHETMVQVEGCGLYLLPALKSMENSSELLNSQRMASILNTLKTEFDFILLDSPPIIPLADVNILTKLIDGLLFVVRAGKTPRDIVLKAVNSINHAKIVGVVLNGVNSSSKKYYYAYGRGE